MVGPQFPSPLCPPPPSPQKSSPHRIKTKNETQKKVYFFRWIIHNYSNPYAVKILRALIPALKPGARILINDNCLSEAGSENPWDEARMHRMDLVMLALLNAQERTEAEFRELFRTVDEGFVFKVRFSVSCCVAFPPLPPFPRGEEKKGELGVL